MNGGILDDFKNAFNRQDNGHIQLILVNLITFLVLILMIPLLDLSGNSETFRTILTYLAMPSSIEKFIVKPWTIITYMFVHIGFFHILFNMLFLYWFGRVVRDYLGSSKVINLYILGGLAGGLFYIFLYNVIPFFADRVENSILFGASAGVFGVVVGAATLMPNYTFFLLFIGPVRIKYIALFYVILSFANMTGSNAGGDIAHLGGAVLGFFYIKQLQKGKDWGTFIDSTLTFIKSFFKKQSKIKVSYSNKDKSTSSYSSSSSKKNSSEASQEEIDAILDKISQSGYESLTKEEKQKLFNASKK